LLGAGRVGLVHDDTLGATVSDAHGEAGIEVKTVYRLGMVKPGSVAIAWRGDYCPLKSTPAHLLVAFILITSSGLGTLQVVTTITWKWGVGSYVVATALAVVLIGALAMMDTPIRIPARLAGWLSAALLLVLALLYSWWYDLEPTWDRGDALAVGVSQLM